MQITMLQGKIHRATVTQAELDYVGSITVDEDLLDAAGIKEYQLVQIVDVNNGNRFETYTIAGERGSGVMCLNGAAARMVSTGDKVIIMSYAQMTPEEIKENPPKVVFVNHGHDTVCDEFAKSIENELEISALAPYSGDGFELGDVVRQVDIGPRKLYDKKLHKIERNNTVYDRLYLAGQNLMSVIEASRGCPNKELGKLTDQITALIEKYKQD